MGFIKKLLKITIGIVFIIIYGIMFFWIKLFAFIFPGKCEQCSRKKWNWFRYTTIRHDDAPLIVCRTCKENNKLAEVKE